jgi:hypothetical protein
LIRKREVSREKSFFCFFFSFLLFLQAREAGKSGLVLFHEAMEKFDPDEPEESFECFERAAAKGHKESIWIVSVVKDVEIEWDALIEAFAITEEPRGWYFAGKFSGGRERFDFMKKSAEGGCSWGQVEYGLCFGRGEFVGEDFKVYAEWLEKAANQNNPKAMHWLGLYHRSKYGDKMKSVVYHQCAAELGWKSSMPYLAQKLRDGEGCEKDLIQAVVWGAKGGSRSFWNTLRTARTAFEDQTTEELDCDFNQLCYSLGWGFYWYQFGADNWDDDDAFYNHCLDFYCSCVELQQKSIFAFLLCWNRTTRGVKGPGQIISRILWKQREDNLVKTFELSRGEEPELRIR